MSRNTRENVEPLGISEHRFREDFSPKRGKRNAVAGISMCKKNTGTEPTKVRHAGSRDSNRATPGKLNRSNDLSHLRCVK